MDAVQGRTGTKVNRGRRTGKGHTWKGGVHCCSRQSRPPFWQRRRPTALLQKGYEVETVPKRELRGRLAEPFTCLASTVATASRASSVQLAGRVEPDEYSRCVSWHQDVVIGQLQSCSSKQGVRSLVGQGPSRVSCTVLLLGSLDVEEHWACTPTAGPHLW